MAARVFHTNLLCARGGEGWKACLPSRTVAGVVLMMETDMKTKYKKDKLTLGIHLQVINARLLLIKSAHYDTYHKLRN